MNALKSVARTQRVNINALDIMQGSRDIEQNENKMTGYLCVRPYILFILIVQQFCIVF